jgi:hypothetical protein
MDAKNPQEANIQHAKDNGLFSVLKVVNGAAERVSLRLIKVENFGYLAVECPLEEELEPFYAGAVFGPTLVQKSLHQSQLSLQTGVSKVLRTQTL